MNRRGFLKGILFTASAPAIVRVASLMPIVTPTVWRSPYLTDPNTWYIKEPFTGIICRAPAQVLWPGIKAWWDEAYRVMPVAYKDFYES